jgi:hypothetical protein
MTNFEDHLWQEFVSTEHGDALARMSRPEARHAQSRRRPVLLTSTGLGLAGLATGGVLALAAGGAAPAFAVTKNTDGTVAITLSDLSALPALNQKLIQEGIPVVAVAMDASCTIKPGQFASPSGVPVGRPASASAAVRINPSDIPSGDVGVIGVMKTDTGRLRVLATVDAPAPGPSCLNPAAYAPGGDASAAQAREPSGDTRLIKRSGRRTRRQGTTG